MDTQSSAGSKISRKQASLALVEQRQCQEFLEFSGELMRQEQHELKNEWRRRMEIGEAVKRAISRAQQRDQVLSTEIQPRAENEAVSPESMFSIEELSDLEKTENALGTQPGIFVHKISTKQKNVAILSVRNLPYNETLRARNILRASRQVYLNNTNLDIDKAKYYAGDATRLPITFFLPSGDGDHRYCFTMMPYSDPLLADLPILKKECSFADDFKLMREELHRTTPSVSRFFNDIAQAEVAHVLLAGELAAVFLKETTDHIYADNKRIYPIVDRAGELKAVAVSSNFPNALEVLEDIPHQVKSIETLKSGSSSQCTSNKVLRIRRDVTVCKNLRGFSKAVFADVLVVAPVEALKALHFTHNEIKGISDKTAGLPVVMKAQEITGDSGNTDKIHQEDPAAAMA
ncbi:MAG TPA: hypothetical protein DEA55_07710 [Rhodospirillaceae bacterium]|nr:hypothetical protein [Rhodospirillaceae bacterium]